MKRRVVVRRLAKADIDRARGYDENERVSLGLRFVETVDQAIDRIAENALQYPLTHRGMRRVLLFPFPDGLFFKIQSGVVRVYAVIHTARHPAHWRRRG